VGVICTAVTTIHRLVVIGDRAGRWETVQIVLIPIHKWLIPVGTLLRLVIGTIAIVSVSAAFGLVVFAVNILREASRRKTQKFVLCVVNRWNIPVRALLRFVFSTPAVVSVGAALGVVRIAIGWFVNVVRFASRRETQKFVLCVVNRWNIPVRALLRFVFSTPAVVSVGAAFGVVRCAHVHVILIGAIAQVTVPALFGSRSTFICPPITAILLTPAAVIRRVETSDYVNFAAFRVIRTPARV